MLRQLFNFKGGVKPQTNKAPSVQAPIGQAPLPSRLYVPLHQSIGGTPHPLVQPGEQVLKGQLIGSADGWLSAAVHAPTSGTVLAIEDHVAAHPSGLPTLSVVRDSSHSRNDLTSSRVTRSTSMCPKNGSTYARTRWAASFCPFSLL